MAFRATSPDDRAQLTALFTEAFDSSPGSSLLDPALMAWKYWEIREDWPGPRSFVLEKDGHITAHAGIWPATFGDDPSARHGIQMIDWAAAKDSPGAGLALVQKLTRMFDFIYSIGGSDVTRKVLPGFGFVELARAWTAARPLRPLRQILSHQHVNWKLAPRLARNWSWSSSPPDGEIFHWKVGNLTPSDISALTPTAGDAWFCPRSAAFFQYLLRCPTIKYRLYGLSNEDGPQGHFALATVRGQARLNALWIRNAGQENLRIAYTLAQQTARELDDAYEVAARGTEGPSGVAAAQAGFRIVESTPVYFHSTDGKFTFPKDFQFQMSDDDAVFLDTGNSSFYT